MKRTINSLQMTERSTWSFLDSQCSALRGARHLTLTSSKAEEFNNCLIHWPDSRLQLLFTRPDSSRLALVFLSVTHSTENWSMDLHTWLCSGTGTGTAPTPSTALSCVPDHTHEQDMEGSTLAVYLMAWGQTLLWPSFPVISPWRLPLPQLHPSPKHR